MCSTVPWPYKQTAKQNVSAAPSADFISTVPPEPILSPPAGATATIITIIRRGAMNTRFSGKVVLIAGGTGGLGKAVSRAFLEEEASVIVTYRNPAEFAALETLAHAAGTNSLEGHAVDVTDESATGP